MIHYCYIIIRFITSQIQDFPDIYSTIYRRGANDCFIHLLALIKKINCKGRGGDIGEREGVRLGDGDKVKYFPPYPSLFLGPLNFPHFPFLF